MIKLPALKLPALQPKERLLAAACVVVLLIVGVDALALRPWLAYVRTLRQDVQRAEQLLQQFNRLLVRRDRVLGELEPYKRYIRPTIAADLQMASFLTEIEDLAAKSGVRVAEIKPSDVEQEDAVTRYSLDVRFSCTLDQWVELVYLIESSTSLFEVSRAGLSTKSEEPDRLEGTVRVSSTTVRMNQAPPAPVPEHGASGPPGIAR